MADFPFDRPPAHWTETDDVPRARGVYAIFLTSVDVVPEVWRSSLLRDDGLLFIGKGDPDLRRRLRRHFSGSSISDTFRKSVGAVLGAELHLTPKEAGMSGKGWKWDDASESAISQWLQAYCQYCFLPRSSRLQEFEKSLIEAHKPPLNIGDNPAMLVSLKEARNKYREKALGRKG